MSLERLKEENKQLKVGLEAMEASFKLTSAKLQETEGLVALAGKVRSRRTRVGCSRGARAVPWRSPRLVQIPYASSLRPRLQSPIMAEYTTDAPWSRGSPWRGTALSPPG